MKRHGLLSSDHISGAGTVDAADFADFFLDLPGGPDPAPDFDSIIDAAMFDEPESRLEFRVVTTRDVIQSALSVAEYKSAGHDEIFMSLIFDSLPFTAPLFADLFNRILETGIDPDN